MLKRKSLTEAQERDVVKGIQVAKEMLSDPDIMNREKLLRYLERFGVPPVNWPAFSKFQSFANATWFGAMQIPTEFVDYLLYCAERKVESLIEIGVYSGASSAFACAFFKSINPQFRYVCVDITDENWMADGFSSLLGWELHLRNTSEAFTNQSFDVAFIDGDHSYLGAKADFVNVGRNAKKICAFHDVDGREYIPEGGGIYKFWRDLKLSYAMKYRFVEFTHSEEECFGIGVIDYTA